MTVWEITNLWANEVAGLTHADDIEFDPVASAEFWKQFDGSGSLLRWNTRPRLTTIKYGGHKKNRPRADVSPFTSPGLIVNGKVREAVGGFLNGFGQFLEVDVDGQVEYFYYVTNVLECLDRKSSTIEAYYVERPAFHEHLIPVAPTVFVDLEIAGRIFVNDEAKKILEKGMTDNGLVGMGFANTEKAGSLFPPKTGSGSLTVV